MDGIIDLEELEIGGRVFERVDPPGILPKTKGWMHSGCAITDDGTVVVAHPLGRRLLEFAPDGDCTEVEIPVLEMHTIFRDEVDGQECLWICNNGHRFVEDVPDYAHYRERGSVIRVALDGKVLQEIDCPTIPSYADERWQPTSLCRAADGSIWIADGYGLSLIHEFTPTGGYLRTIDAAETGTRLDTPHGIARRGDQIIVADRTNKRLLVLEDGYVAKVLDAPLTSPSSILIMGQWMLVTELFGGLAVFHGDEYQGHFARSTDDAERDAWPNVRDAAGNMTAPPLDGKLHAPHGIATDGNRIVITEWLIGGRLNQYLAQTR